MVDGSPELLLMAGTPYNLTCVTRGAKPAAYIQWTKDGAPVDGAHQATVSRNQNQQRQRRGRGGWRWRGGLGGGVMHH